MTQHIFFHSIPRFKQYFSSLQRLKRRWIFRLMNIWHILAVLSLQKNFLNFKLQIIYDTLLSLPLNTHLLACTFIIVVESYFCAVVIRYERPTFVNLLLFIRFIDIFFSVIYHIQRPCRKTYIFLTWTWYL